jgi:16S rRNA processing protein RimM
VDRALLEVGRIVGAHGLRGEVVVKLVSNRAERSAVGATFHTDVGDLCVTRARGSDGRLVVAFENVTDRPGAERLRGVRLFAPPIEDPDALWVHELLGAIVVDAGTGSTLGTVATVLPNPASDLLELEEGGLIPVRFVVEHRPGRVVVDIPAGLLDEV